MGLRLRDRRGTNDLGNKQLKLSDLRATSTYTYYNNHTLSQTYNKIRTHPTTRTTIGNEYV